MVKGKLNAVCLLVMLVLTFPSHCTLGMVRGGPGYSPAVEKEEVTGKAVCW